MRWKLWVICCLLPPLSGCSQILPVIFGPNPNAASLLPPLEDYYGYAPSDRHKPSSDEGVSETLYADFQKPSDPRTLNRSVVAKMVADAETNCEQFESTMVTSEVGTNLASDISATAFSAVGAVVAPVSAAHIASAGAAISTGTGANINQDYFGKVSLQAFAASIQSTFGKEIQAYNDALNDIAVSDDASIIPAVEYEKIDSMLADCALGPATNTAIVTLSQTQNGANGSPGTSTSSGSARATQPDGSTTRQGGLPAQTRSVVSGQSTAAPAANAQ